MALLHPTYDHQSNRFLLNDPVKTFYIKSDTELIPNQDYYISLHIGGSCISFTNKFHKVVIDGIELYEVDFFKRKFTLPFSVLRHHNYASLIGWSYASLRNNIQSIYRFTDIYYDVDKEYFFSIGGEGEELIIYNDCQLIDEMRKDRPSTLAYDNVLVHMSGMCALRYDYSVLHRNLLEINFAC